MEGVIAVHDVPLTIAMRPYDHVRGVLDGRIPVPGIRLTHVDLPMPEINARFAAGREWELSEFGLGKYAALRSRGDDGIIAIPVFSHRAFRQRSIYVRADSPLRDPRALAGRTVGVPEWAGFPVALFPALALTVFGAGAPGLGLLVSAIAVGALAASVLSGPLTAMRRKGIGVTVLFTVWGTAIALFGLATFSFPLALFLLAVAGAADIAAAVLRASIVQGTIPDAMRGRVASINSLIATGGPRLGDFEATIVAGFTSVPFSVVSGGVLCVLGTLVVARAFPQLLAFGKDRAPTS